jgi:phosphotransferase family enzyme
MIEGLDKLLERHDQLGLSELRGLLQELLGGCAAQGRLIEQQMLQPRAARVFRLRFVVNGQARAMVLKRLKPEIAHRSQLVDKRWLPAAGMSQHGPAVLGTVTDRGGSCAWQVYDDLGQHELDTRQINRERVRAAVEVIARLHTRFARHALLGEVRLHGGDLGIHFYAGNVRDAIYALEACQPGPQHTALRSLLFKRLYGLRKELPQRAQALEAWGGPETLLHGDLWAINIFAIPTANGLEVRLIDWDHAAVGPASYDLSTFLLRFPRQERSWILDLYREETSRAGWNLPSEQILNFLFETAEYARIANRIIWPAIALVEDQAPWAWDTLAEVYQWFENLEPVLPCLQEMHVATI